MTLKKLANMMLHPFPEKSEMASRGLKPIGKPMGGIALEGQGLHPSMSPEELREVARKMIQAAYFEDANAILIGGLTSLHHHLINMAHLLGWEVWENISRPMRICRACAWKEEGRFDDCPRCGSKVQALHEFAGMRKVARTFPQMHRMMVTHEEGIYFWETIVKVERPDWGTKKPDWAD